MANVAAEVVSQIGNFVNTTLSASTYNASSFASALKAQSIPNDLYSGYDWDTLSIAEKWWVQWVSVCVCVRSLPPRSPPSSLAGLASLPVSWPAAARRDLPPGLRLLFFFPPRPTPLSPLVEIVAFARSPVHDSSAMGWIEAITTY